MVLDEGRSIAAVARSLEVIEGTLGNWVAKARTERARARHWMPTSVMLSPSSTSVARTSRPATKQAHRAKSRAHEILQGFQGRSG